MVLLANSDARFDVRNQRANPMRHDPRLRNLLTLIGVVAAVALTACAPSTTLEQGWTTPTARAQPPLTNVVTLFVSDSVTMRRTAEDRLARELTANGVVATPSYAILTADEARAFYKAVDQKGADTPMTSRLRSMGYDGVVLMKIVDKDQDLVYTPSNYDPGWGYPFWGYSGPDLAYTETIYRTETNAYSLITNTIVWSGITKSVDPSPKSLIDETSHVVASQLVKRGLAG
jgi:hypothetical protein